MKQSILNVPIFLALFIFVSFLSDLSAQEKEQQSFKTIFDNTKPLHISGFGGPIVEFSTIANDFAVSSGGGGGVIVNNIFIGAYGIGLSTNHYSDVCYVHTASSSSIPYNYSNDRINFGHGGFWIGGSFKPQEALHLSLSSKLGWGNISFYDNSVQNQNLYNVNDNVFVLLPQAELEMNLSRWFKINLGIGYRIVTGINEIYSGTNCSGIFIEKTTFFNQKDFNSLTGTISFLFGGF